MITDERLNELARDILFNLIERKLIVEDFHNSPREERNEVVAEVEKVIKQAIAENEQS